MTRASRFCSWSPLSSKTHHTKYRRHRTYSPVLVFGQSHKRCGTLHIYTDRGLCTFKAKAAKVSNSLIILSDSIALREVFQDPSQSLWISRLRARKLGSLIRGPNGTICNQKPKDMNYWTMCASGLRNN